MPSSPAFQFYPDDFLGSAAVAAMSDAEVGIYVRLLCYEWNGGGLPVDPDALARMLRISRSKFDAAWVTVGPCFVERDGRLYNPRLDKEREKQQQWRDKSSAGGRKSAEKRWGSHKGSDNGGVTTLTECLQPNGNTPVSSLQTVVTTTTTCDADAPPVPKRRKKTDPPPAPSRASWLTPIAAVWEASKGAGTFPWGKAGKTLKPLHGAGHSPEAIAGNLGRYLVRTDPQFVSLARFVETFSDYAAADISRYLDAYGWMTPELERETRPPGMRGVA